MQPVQDLTVDARVSRTQYQYTLDDPNTDELNTLAPKVIDVLRTRPELRDVSSDQQDKGLRVALSIDRSTAARLGITPQNIDDTLYDAFGQRQVSTIFTELNQYRVVLAVKPDFQQGPAGLQSIYLRGTSGGQVPLAAITQASETTGPLVINRQGQFPAVTMSFNLAPRASLGEAVEAIEDTARQLNLPASIQGSFPGNCPGLQGLAHERAASDPGRAHNGLYRARRIVRKLHPSGHDPFHASLGRGRRRAFVDALSHANSP